MNEPAIKLKRLTRYFGKNAVVRDLDFRVLRGKTTALLGLNGAGKTTTIRILMGLLAATRGTAITLGETVTGERATDEMVTGEMVTGDREHNRPKQRGIKSSKAGPIGLSIETRRRIGYLVEGHFLYPNLTVQQCQTFQRAEFQEWNRQLFDDIVRHFAIDRNAKVSTLSRGQRAGVSLALALAPDPELLVLDDPALGLDPVSRRALNETLIEFAGGGKRTVLLSTHMLDDVERIADRVAVMIGGQLKVDTTMDDFASRLRQFEIDGDQFDPARIAAVPGLIEARQLGGRLKLIIADADAETQAAIARLGVTTEETRPSFSDSILSYLTRERGDESFFGPNPSGPSSSGPTSLPSPDPTPPDTPPQTDNDLGGIAS